MLDTIFGLIFLVFEGLNRKNNDRRQPGACSNLAVKSPIIYKPRWNMKVQSELRNGCLRFTYTCTSFVFELSTLLNNTALMLIDLNEFSCKGDKVHMFASG